MVSPSVTARTRGANKFESDIRRLGLGTPLRNWFQSVSMRFATTLCIWSLPTQTISPEPPKFALWQSQTRYLKSLGTPNPMVYINYMYIYVYIYIYIGLYWCSIISFDLKLPVYLQKCWARAQLPDADALLHGPGAPGHRGRSNVFLYLVSFYPILSFP